MERIKWNIRDKSYSMRMKNFFFSCCKGMLNPSIYVCDALVTELCPTNVQDSAPKATKNMHDSNAFVSQFPLLYFIFSFFIRVDLMCKYLN